MPAQEANLGCPRSEVENAITSQNKFSSLHSVTTYNTAPGLVPFARCLSRLISAHTRRGSGRAWICRVGYTDPELGKVDAASVRRIDGCFGPLVAMWVDEIRTLECLPAAEKACWVEERPKKPRRIRKLSRVSPQPVACGRSGGYARSSRTGYMRPLLFQVGKATSLDTGASSSHDVVGRDTSVKSPGTAYSLITEPWTCQQAAPEETRGGIVKHSADGDIYAAADNGDERS